MKEKLKRMLAISCALVLVASCSRHIMPPFTDVSKITQLRSGMKVKQVSDILGIEPYDIFYMQETGAQILSFNYRVKERVMYTYNTLNYMEIGRRTSDENSQTAGEVYYDKKYRTLYAIFSPTGDLTSYITTTGERDRGKLMVIGNTLSLYDQNNTTLLDSLYNKAFNPDYGNRPVRISIDRDGKFIDDMLDPPAKKKYRKH